MIFKMSSERPTAKRSADDKKNQEDVVTDPCGICYDSLDETNRELCELPCKHRFHTECFHQHFCSFPGVSIVCAMCRQVPARVKVLRDLPICDFMNLLPGHVKRMKKPKDKIWTVHYVVGFMKKDGALFAQVVWKEDSKRGFRHEREDPQAQWYKPETEWLRCGFDIEIDNQEISAFLKRINHEGYKTVDNWSKTEGNFGMHNPSMNHSSRKPALYACSVCNGIAPTSEKCNVLIHMARKHKTSFDPSQEEHDPLIE